MGEKRIRCVARKGPCRHCGVARWIQARGLCQPCYRRPDIKGQYARLAETVNQHDEMVPILPVLSTYPNHGRRQRCACEAGWDGECVPCERVLRTTVFVDMTSGGNELLDG